MPYSAVIQPRPCPLSHGGTRSSRLAVQSTCVLPNFIRQEPSAWSEKARWKLTGRRSPGCRFEGRILTCIARRVLGAGNSQKKRQGLARTLEHDRKKGKPLLRPAAHVSRWSRAKQTFLSSPTEVNLARVAVGRIPSI